MDKKQILKDVLESGIWGTIGPKSISAAKLIAKRVSGQYGLLTYSASAALEVQLRSLGIGYKDEVIIASYSDPMDSMVAVNVGATPVFADILLENATLSADSVEKVISDKTKAVIVDAIGGNPFDIKQLVSLCEKRGVKIILNLKDGYNATFEGEPLTQHAYGTVIDLADGLALSAGEGGALIHNDEAAHKAGAAFHNCGRPLGETVGLEMDNILGGDYRITEWQAAIAEAELNELDVKLAGQLDRANRLADELNLSWLTPLHIIPGGVSSYSFGIFWYHKDKNNGLSIDSAVDELCSKGYKACRPWRAMHRQPVFKSDYFKKVTGYTKGYNDDNLKNSIAAEDGLIWIKTFSSQA